MEIKRDLYLDKLIARKHNGLIKVVTGIRRCGKSYLLNTLFYNHLLASGVPDDHIIKFAFDSADDLVLIGESLIKLEKSRKRVDPEKFMAYIRSKIVGKQMYYLLLDEVQLLDCFESVLNGYLRKDNMDVYVTGSNAKFLVEGHHHRVCWTRRRNPYVSAQLLRIYECLFWGQIHGSVGIYVIRWYPISCTAKRLKRKECSTANII